MQAKRLAFGVVGAALTAALALGGTAGAQTNSGAPASAPASTTAPKLFAAAGGAQSADAAGNPAIARSRAVTINTAALLTAAGAPADAAAVPTVALNLFADANYTGVVQKAWSDGWGSYWTGALREVKGGYFYLTLVDGAFMAHVASPLGVYEVKMVADGTYRSVQIDQSKLSDHGKAPLPPTVGKAVPVGSLGATADTGATIDIMVAYTATARAAAGSTAAMKATILTALNETNTSYANSGVTPRLRLVHVEEVAYTESGNISTDVNRLKGTADTYMDGLHAIRNTYGADMVGLVVENGGGYCGMAAAIMATATTAFQVTARSCATGYYSFGHEFGHLQGARHDTYVDSSTTPYAYGHAHVNTGSTAGTRWRTIMGYNDKCAALGYNCTRLQYWSNPTKTYSAAAMGVVGTSENYKVLNTTAYTVANFRTAVIGSNFSSPFTADAAGWTPVYGTWSVAGGSYQSAGAANLVSSVSNANIHGDVTFEARLQRSGLCNSCANRIIIRGNPAIVDASKVWNPSYFLQYNNNGQVSVYRMSGGTYTILMPWTASAAVVKGGWNTLKVVAVGSKLQFYVNGTNVWNGTDTTLKTGKVGVGFYRDVNAGTLLIDSATATNTPTAGTMADAMPAAVGTPLAGGSADMGPSAS